jgi:hypothetical protein
MRAPSRLSVVGIVACMAVSSACGKGSAPDIDEVAPRAICIDQGSATVTVSGHGLAPMVRRGLTNPEAIAPGVSLVPARTFGLETGQATRRSIALSSSSVRWSNRSTLAFDIAPGTAAPGIYDIEIVNPNGERTRIAEGLVIVPPPSAGLLEPEVIAHEGANSITVRGDFFFATSAAQPTVLVHGAGPEPLALAVDGAVDCIPLPGPDSPRLCRAVTIALPAGALPPGAFAVEVVNPAPASCTTRGFAAGTEDRLPLTVVPRPTIATVGQGVSCIAEGDEALTVTGEGFLLHGGGSPTLYLGDLALPTTAAGCTDAPLAEGFAPRARALSICTELQATLPQGSMPPGIVPAIVENPPTSPGASDPTQYLVAGPPVVSRLASDVVCAEDGDPSVHVFGQGFLKVAAETPVVRLGALELPAEAGGCAPVAGLAQPIEVCTELSVELPEESLAGPYPLVVRNPAFAPCSSIEPITVFNVAPPTIATVEPPRFCSAVDAELSLTGTDFLVLGGVLPTVEIGGEEVTAVPKGCLPIAGSTTAQRCTGLDLAVPAGTVETASQEIEVENPAPADCGATAPVPVEVALPPVISSARVVVTVGGAAVIEISGSNFLPGASVSVDGLATSGGAVVSPTSAVAVVAPGESGAGGATVTIDNGDGCAASASVSVGAIPAPRPGLTASGSPAPLLSTRAAASAVTTPLTITGADGAVSVALRGSAGSLGLPFAADPLRPGYLLAALPRGVAAGRYDVLVTDGAGRSEPAGRLEVVDTAAAEVAEAVQDEGARLALADGDGAGLPAAFLVRSGGDDAAVAIPLARVARRGDGTLEVGTAGASPEPGDYDLLLVEPAGDGAAAGARAARRALHVAASGPDRPEFEAVARELSPPRPEIVAVSLVAAETGGLAPGTWHYRVAALFPAGDETAASEPAGIDVPGDAGRPVAVELAWLRVDGAVGYRVYRTAGPGAPAGAERFLAETPADATSFVDGGNAESTTTRPPAATDPDGAPTPSAGEGG